MAHRWTDEGHRGVGGVSALAAGRELQMTSSLRRVRRWQRVGLGFAVGYWLVAAFILLAAPAYADDCLAYHQAQRLQGQPLGPCPVPRGGSQQPDQSQTDETGLFVLIGLGALGAVGVAAAASSSQAKPGPTPQPQMPAPSPEAQSQVPVVADPGPGLMPKGWLAYQQQQIAQRQAAGPAPSEWDWDQGFRDGETSHSGKMSSSPPMLSAAPAPLAGGWLEYQQQQIAQKQAAEPALREFENQQRVGEWARANAPRHHYLDQSDPRSYGSAWWQQQLDDLTTPIGLNPHIRDFVLDQALGATKLGAIKDMADVISDTGDLIGAALGLSAYPLIYDPKVRRYYADYSSPISTSEAFHTVSMDVAKLALPESVKRSVDVAKLGRDLLNDAVKARIEASLP